MSTMGFKTLSTVLALGFGHASVWFSYQGQDMYVLSCVRGTATRTWLWFATLHFHAIVHAYVTVQDFLGVLSALLHTP